MNGPVLVILAAGRARRFGGVKPLAPIGVAGEAVIDLIASDAYDAGFAHVVIVVNPDTGPLIREYVAQNWPSGASVSFAIQERPLGTVHAVLSAYAELDTSVPFGVCNADDLYGFDAMHSLGQHLANDGGNCLVGFRLDQALVGDQPVTRGVCRVENNRLLEIVERRSVQFVNGAYVIGDGREPSTLTPDNLVSMNLWGFSASMWDVFHAAMAAATDASEDAEVLLPEVVGREVASGTNPFAVLPAASKCIGVTHPDDLALVQADVQRQVEQGIRPATAFSNLL